MEYIPECGDAIWLDFNPQKGHEQLGRRPALVLSPRAYNGKVGLALLCPITAQIKGYPFEVVIPNNLKVAGAILADQIKSLDWRVRRADYICTLPESVISDVLQRLETLLPMGSMSQL
jgi:mRNA interferase MazF